MTGQRVRKPSQGVRLTEADNWIQRWLPNSEMVLVVKRDVEILSKGSCQSYVFEVMGFQPFSEWDLKTRS